MYGSSLIPSSVNDPHGLDPAPRERHGAQLKAAKHRGRHARHKSHKPFGWLHPHQDQPREMIGD
ncbi:hypothetical protein [Actinospica robiniae]|uniref:hypothetical protein n=1 Tax=Actinospica robiniae TaxID=304901 RepID=UPI0003FBCFD5|nr:hypothetical protein [Actinospica robiniae]